MINLEIPHSKDIWTDELKQPGDWVVANIDASFGWPVTVQKLQYDQREFWIIPVTRDAYPGIASRVNGVSREEVQKRILQLLSVISWVEDKGAVLDSFSGGNLPRSMGRSKDGGFMIRESFDLPYLPIIDSNSGKLALALMREGRGLNHPAYAFLSFFRVLEVAIGSGEKRRSWMSDAVDRVEDRKSIESISELRKTGVKNIARHLFESGRCAIAHAAADPIVDPDDPSDSRRISSELPIMESLATMAIEEKLGVKTSRTVYREHFYELAGFKTILGREASEELAKGEAISRGASIELPNISVRLRDKPPFPPLENMSLIHVDQCGSKLLIRYRNKDATLQIEFHLNFASERLEFDIHNSVFGAEDDGSAAYAERRASMIEFEKWYYLNGSLVIVDTETGEEISRKDPFIPVNIIVRPEKFDESIESWRVQARNRSVAPSG